MGKKKLSAKTYPISYLNEVKIKRLFALFVTCYDNVKFEDFEKDIKEKEKIILMTDQFNEIQGFSTLKTFNLQINSRKYFFLFSGDTVISPDFWGTSALTMEFLKNIIFEKCKHPFHTVYWYLITKGYKTYLLLANNFINYYPRFDTANTPEVENVLNHASEFLYPGAFQKDTGLLIFQDHQKLKEDIAPITKDQLVYPKIRFFVERNPGWQEGEELACIGEVNFSLLIVHPLKILKKNLQRFFKIRRKYSQGESVDNIKT